MAERRFNESEVAAIFEQATKTLPPGAADASGSEGMTLVELQEIGREVGIPAGSIALAAQSIGRSPAASRTLWGLPVGVERTIELSRPLSDAEWERFVVDLRETFSARGTMTGQGSLRQWTNGNLQALLEPTATGQRIRLRTVKGNATLSLTVGAGMMGLSSLLLVVATVQGALADLGMVTALSMLGVAGAVMAGSTALRLPQWARTRRRQMEEIAARTTFTDGE